MNNAGRRLGWLALAGFLGLSVAPVCSQQSRPVPTVKSVALDSASTADMRILGGPPETVTMRSGSVALLPSKSVGKHNTDDYEEVVVVLSGTGELRLTNGTTVTLKPFVVAYCPPGTEHDVTNTGHEPLRYVYVVAKAK